MGGPRKAPCFSQNALSFQHNSNQTVHAYYSFRARITQRKLRTTQTNGGHCSTLTCLLQSILHSCVKTFPLSFENHSQTDRCPPQNCTIVQEVIPKTWQECLYTILYKKSQNWEGHGITIANYAC